MPETDVADLAKQALDDSEPTRVAAIKELLDRGYRVPSHFSLNADDEGLTLTLKWPHPKQPG